MNTQIVSSGRYEHELEVQYESLSRGDVTALAPALKQAGMTIAYPHLADPVVAKVNGEIIGFGFAQLLPHSEPIWIYPKWRGNGIAEELARRVVEKIEASGAQRYCCIAQSQFAEKLCEQMGMKAVPGVLYVKDPERG
jgi:GNAT superfamily N-acetyltransferase